jgi:hypothetical protein
MNAVMQMFYYEKKVCQVGSQDPELFLNFFSSKVFQSKKTKTKIMMIVFSCGVKPSRRVKRQN